MSEAKGQQVNIVAPSDMEAGYQFDAQVDGKVVSNSLKSFVLISPLQKRAKPGLTYPH